MSLFKEFVMSAPVTNRLPFGVVENVRVLKLDTSVRKNKGLPIKQHNFITLVEIDPETNTVIAQSEGAYWDLDHSNDFTMNNFIEEFTSLAALISAYGGDMEEFEKDVLEACPKDKQVDSYINTKEGAKVMQDSLAVGALKYISPNIGATSILLKCKVTTNKKGYFELGKELNWILPMDSEDDLANITAIEKRRYRESLKADNKKKTEQPDGVGEKKVANSSFGGL